MISLSKIFRLGMSALSLFALISTSSCSKDDVDTPQPLKSTSNPSSNMRDGGGMSLLIPTIPKTDGPVCNGCFATDWWRLNFDSSIDGQDAFEVPTGTSSTTHLFGNFNTPWLIPLPVPAGPGAFITASALGEFNGRKRAPSVGAHIRNLIPGRTYEITFQVATSRTVNSQFAKVAQVWLSASEGEVPFINIDLTANPGQWITKKLTFKAGTSQAHLNFNSIVQMGLCYSHIYVGKNAIKMVD